MKPTWGVADYAINQLGLNLHDPMAGRLPSTGQASSESRTCSRDEEFAGFTLSIMREYTTERR